MSSVLCLIYDHILWSFSPGWVWRVFSLCPASISVSSSVLFKQWHSFSSTIESSLWTADSPCLSSHQFPVSLHLWLGLMKFLPCILMCHLLLPFRSHWVSHDDEYPKNRDSMSHLDNRFSLQITRFSDFYKVSTLCMLPFLNAFLWALSVGIVL